MVSNVNSKLSVGKAVIFFACYEGLTFDLIAFTSLNLWNSFELS
jgi:hypothetical protein